MPYMLDTLPHPGQRMPHRPEHLPCKAAPGDACALLLRPRSRLEFLRVLARVKDDPSLHCLLLALPTSDPTDTLPIAPSDHRHSPYDPFEEPANLTPITEANHRHSPYDPTPIAPPDHRHSPCDPFEEPANLTPITEAEHRHSPCDPFEEPAGLISITEADLRQWVRDAAARSPKPLCIATCTEAPYPCGKQPCCQTHVPTRHREQLESLTTLLGRCTSLDAAIDAAFPTLSPDQRRLLQLWAHLEDPKDKGRPIHRAALAMRFNISTRQVSRILAAAKTTNPDLFQKLTALRDFRFRKAGTYQVEHT